jgi:mutator protein MutT
METTLRQATLCFLVRGNEILLAMKKRGHGEGFWNGAGGKPEPGEAIEAAAVREVQEEIGVTPLNLREVGKLDFYTHQSAWDQQVVVYVATEWEGDPAESEEMRPQWHSQRQLPFDQMWPDDRHWLPHVLAGRYVTGRFRFDERDQMVSHEVTAL